MIRARSLLLPRQNWLYPKLLSPLGASSIAAVDPLSLFPDGIPGLMAHENPYDNSPFYAENRSFESDNLAVSDATGDRPDVNRQVDWLAFQSTENIADRASQKSNISSTIEPPSIQNKPSSKSVDPSHSDRVKESNLTLSEINTDRSTSIIFPKAETEPNISSFSTATNSDAGESQANNSQELQKLKVIPPTTEDRIFDDADSSTAISSDTKPIQSSYLSKPFQTDSIADVPSFSTQADLNTDLVRAKSDKELKVIPPTIKDDVSKPKSSAPIPANTKSIQPSRIDNLPQTQSRDNIPASFPQTDLNTDGVPTKNNNNSELKSSAPIPADIKLIQSSEIDNLSYTEDTKNNSSFLTETKTNTNEVSIKSNEELEVIPSIVRDDAIADSKSSAPIPADTQAIQPSYTNKLPQIKGTEKKTAFPEATKLSDQQNIDSAIAPKVTASDSPLVRPTKTKSIDAPEQVGFVTQKIQTQPELSPTIANPTEPVPDNSGKSSANISSDNSDVTPKIDDRDLVNKVQKQNIPSPSPKIIDRFEENSTTSKNLQPQSLETPSLTDPQASLSPLQPKATEEQTPVVAKAKTQAQLLLEPGDRIPENQELLNTTNINLERETNTDTPLSVQTKAETVSPSTVRQIEPVIETKTSATEHQQPIEQVNSAIESVSPAHQENPPLALNAVSESNNLLAQTQTTSSAIAPNPQTVLTDSVESNNSISDRSTVIPTIQTKPASPKSNKPDRSVEIPQSWSSIEDLIGIKDIPTIGPQFTSVPETVIQPLSDKSDRYESVPLAFAEKPLPITPPSSELSTDIVRLQSQGENSVETEAEEADDRDRLEILAQEIYFLLKQRLEIERERQGGYYSNRLF